MFSVMLYLSVLFVAGVFWIARQFVQQTRQGQLTVLFRIRKDLEDLLRQRSDLVKQKDLMSRKADQLFTLYDMTKEIVRKSNEQEAFEVFRTALKANVRFQDCRLVHAEGDRRKQMMSPTEYLIFPIRGHHHVLGYIGIKGLEDDEKDKFVILAQQFALALQRVKLHQEVEQSAITDSLTGAHTRRYLMERLEEEIARSKARQMALSLLMVDVDYFKSFNDKYGHLVGDQILRSISLLIQENTREIDYIGRYGGEEFCVVLPDTDSEGGLFVAERIRKSIEESDIHAYDTRLKVTVSIGIASIPKDTDNALELIDKADWALYRSKKRGRNCITSFGAYSKEPQQP
ncbi:MAG TPA: diguanylate cyclase [Candidatus Omnitrophota bacterium]|nr:diguanylate cyclase [Candidatus Omnitrophota bacterium]